MPLPAPDLEHPLVIAGEEADPETQPPSMGEEEPQTPPAQVGGSGPRLLSRPGADSGRGAPLPEAASVRDQEKPREEQGVRGRPGHLVTYSPPETQAASEMLENGEENPGPDSSFDRMLSSSSSMSSLNSSTVRG